MRHCRGVGPARLKQLHELGIRTWHDVVERSDALPGKLRETLVPESVELIEAVERDDIPFLVDRFRAEDRWRILHHYFDRASFFDIETTGLDRDARITVIVCWHRGELRTFVEDDNLDDFLDWLDDVDLLVSFNGTTFDVPRVVDAFHIPELPCPHVDLRWVCYHRGIRGRLKPITEQFEINRPDDVSELYGEEAVDLWWMWHHGGDRESLRRLVRYCAADVILLRLLAARMIERSDVDEAADWKLLDTLHRNRPKRSRTQRSSSAIPSASDAR